MIKVVSLLGFVAAVYALPRTNIPMENRPIDPNGDWRIVGGSTAAVGAYPFMVSIVTSERRHFCGGTIINNINILTAAHCVIGRTTANTIILAGTNTLNSGGVIRGSSRLIVHGSYISTANGNDIAVIRLSSALSFGSTIQQISLTTAHTESVPAILIGWGTTLTDGPIPNNLQHLATNTLTYAECYLYWFSLLNSMQICAVTRAGQGACNGDSGGPLIQTSNRAQLGIVSFGRAGGCAQGYPDVYTRVSSYIAWINSAINS